MLITVPVPSPLLTTVKLKLCSGTVKVAVTFLSPSRSTVQAPVPVQAPFQPAKVALPVGVAVSVTSVLRK